MRNFILVLVNHELKDDWNAKNILIVIFCWSNKIKYKLDKVFMMAFWANLAFYWFKDYNIKYRWI